MISPTCLFVLKGAPTQKNLNLENLNLEWEGRADVPVARYVQID